MPFTLANLGRHCNHRSFELEWKKCCANGDFMDFQQELKLFATKLLILGALLFIPFAATLLVLNNAMISFAARPAIEFGDPITWAGNAAAKIDAMTPEKREAVHHSLRAFAAAIRPFVDDFQPLLRPGDNGASKPNGSP